MNIFNKLWFGQQRRVHRLGAPSRDEPERLLRIEVMASLNPSGFRTPKKAQRTRNGMTRGDRKRLRRAEAREAERERQQKAAEALMDRGLTEAEACARFGSL